MRRLEGAVEENEGASEVHNERLSKRRGSRREGDKGALCNGWQTRSAQTRTHTQLVPKEATLNELPGPNAKLLAKFRPPEPRNWQLLMVL